MNESKQVTSSAIAAHNDGVLAWVLKVAGLLVDDKSTMKYPALASAVERFQALTAGLIAQTGFLPSGSNAGAKDADVNKAFDVLPFPQTGESRYVYAMANPRLADQDTAVLVAILAALAVTVDETSTHDYNGNVVPGGGYTTKKKDAEADDAQPRVKSNNKTFNALCKELGLKKEGKTYTLDGSIHAGLRAECPAFPADAASLPIPKKAYSKYFVIPLTITGKDENGKKTSKSLTVTSTGGLETLFFLINLPKGITCGTVLIGKPSIAASYASLYASHGITLKTLEDAAAEGKSKAPAIVEPSKAEDIPAAA